MINAFDMPVDEILDWREEIDSIVEDLRETIEYKDDCNSENNILPDIRLTNSQNVLKPEKDGNRADKRLKRSNTTDSLPELVDAIVSDGATPKFYCVERQAVPLRVPKSVKMLIEFYKRHPDHDIRSQIPPDFAQKLDAKKRQPLPADQNLMISNAANHGVSPALSKRKAAAEYLLDKIPLSSGASSSEVNAISISAEMQHQLNISLFS